MDKDLLAAIRLFLRHADMTQPLSADMPDDVYNALAFAQQNELTQFTETLEYQTALGEWIIELIGVIEFPSWGG